MSHYRAHIDRSAYGGGVEIVLNCDLVIASDKAQFALYEVKRGVTAIQGGMFIKSYPNNYLC
jgi:enoyl-CoA hydratase/carnithine racemase